VTDSDCVDCDDGLCDWTGCTADADYTVKDVTVVRSGMHIDVGNVDLCGGHHRRAKRLGRLELDWERIWKAVEAQT
jgi:hypothetical protein